MEELKVFCFYLNNIYKFLNLNYKIGVLAVSRAIGDQYLKYNKKDPNIKDQSSFIVTCQPTITKTELNISDTRFLLLACDGVWEVHDTKKVNVMALLDTYM